MAAPRPGNDDRGWNDPPMFDYIAPVALSNTVSPRRTQLNKRVAFPMSGSSANTGGALLNPEQGPPRLADVQLLPPANSLDTPTPVPVLVPTLAPDPGSVGATPCQPAPVPGSPCMSSLVSKLGIETENLQGYVNDSLLQMVDEFREKLQGRAIEDIRRRLDVMNKMWSDDKLSDPVKLKIGNLVHALKENDLNTANQIHISLMVDHTAEVNHWMVAIKRLILEKQNSAQSESKPAETNQESSESSVTFFTPPTSSTVGASQPDTEQSSGLGETTPSKPSDDS